MRKKEPEFLDFKKHKAKKKLLWEKSDKREREWRSSLGSVQFAIKQTKVF